MAHLRVGLMLALTFITGTLDAVGYLGLDRVFTGNMTGNVVILGMGLSGQDGLPVAGPAMALAGYVAGAGLVGRTLAAHGRNWTAKITAVFVANAVVLGGVGAVLATGRVGAASLSGIVIATAIAMVMGAQAAAARTLAVTDMTTVVVTSTLTAYAGETLFKPGLGALKHRRLWAIVAIFGGAVFGSIIMRIDVGVPVYLAAATNAAVALVGHRAWEKAVR